MSNTMTGQLVQVLPVQQGQSSRGAWRRQEFVIETSRGQYNEKAHFSVWGDDKVANLSQFRIGEMIEVSFDYTSREYGGRWYDEGKAWKVARAEAPAVATTDDASFSPELPK